MHLKTPLICLLMLFTLSAQAFSLPSSVKAGVPYDRVRTSLIADGWRPVVNSRIKNSSLYAQEIFEQGSVEVVDCISMALDACSFRYTKNNKMLEIRTITRNLQVDKINLINKK